MKLTLFLCVLLFVCSVSNTSSAAQFSGAYLYNMCEKKSDGGEMVAGGHAVCQSYIAGVVDYHNVLRSLRMAPDVNICVPAGATLNQLHDIVLVFLRRSQLHDGFVAAPAVTMALIEYFPCR
jgi:hypothetical protein